MTTVSVEPDRCQGAGLCALYAPEVFDQDTGDGTVVLLTEVPGEQHLESVELAARLCPNAVITVR